MSFEILVQEARILRQYMMIVGKVTEGTVKIGDPVTMDCGGKTVNTFVYGMTVYMKMLEQASAPDEVMLTLSLEDLDPSLMDACKNTPPKKGDKIIPGLNSSQDLEEPERDLKRLEDDISEKPYEVLEKGIQSLNFVVKILEEATNSIISDLEEHGSDHNMFYGKKDIAFFETLKKKLETLKKSSSELHL